MPSELGDIVACATTLTFAIELYLKGIHAGIGSKVENKHDLRYLFDALPECFRILIKDHYDRALPLEVQRLGKHLSVSVGHGAKAPEEPQWNDSHQSPALPDLLAQSKDAFQSWRYIFEFKQPEGSPYQLHRFEYTGLLCLAKVLKGLPASLSSAGESPVRAAGSDRVN